MKSFLLLFLLTINSIFSQSLKEFRAVKITNVDSNVLFTDQSIADAMDYLASIGVNIILPVVWNGAYTQYQSGVMDSIFGVSIHSQFTGRDPLQRLVIEAHRVGIEVYPWFEYGFAAWYSGNNSTDGGPILKKFPSWALRTSDGKICNKNGFDWMSAVNPEVQNFISSLVKEVITKYDVDGIEFSDRIPALPVEGGYDTVTVAIYRSENNNQSPPSNYRDPSWMRWRADKLNAWLYSVNDLLKAHNKNLFLSSSPSIYPWAYQEYLQDSYSWIRSGKLDHLIPQLYRYSFNEYQYELNNALQYAGASNSSKVFAGILMNLGVGANAYLISSDYLLQSLKANRDKGVMGEAFFYYEGLRKNNDQLGEVLKNSFYKINAQVPDRPVSPWRIPGIILNEDEQASVKVGTWENYLMKGFKGSILRTTGNSNISSITYKFNVPATAYYDVFAYTVSNMPWTQKARYVIYSEKDSSEIVLDQSNQDKKGWQFIGTAYFQAGNSLPIIKLDNKYLESGKYLTADAAMIILNRKLSPNVVTEINDQMLATNNLPTNYSLEQNYPNPFNPITRIMWNIPSDDFVTIKVFDLLGKEIATLMNNFLRAGNHSLFFEASSLASGVYFYQMKTSKFTDSKKMVLLK
jgi:uncharacterized lipoprotein YddW (UPF0748 family)